MITYLQEERACSMWGSFLTQIALFKPMGLSLQDRVGDGGWRAQDLYGTLLRPTQTFVGAYLPPLPPPLYRINLFAPILP